MNDRQKTKEQLIEELTGLRQQVAELMAYVTKWEHAAEATSRRHEDQIEGMVEEHRRELVRSKEQLGQEITERKQAEETLRESEKRYRELFSSMSSGVAVYAAQDDGADFVFTDLNRAAERMDQVRGEDLIGRSVTEAFPGVKEFGLFDVFQRVWRTGEPEHHPISLYRDQRIVGWRKNYVYKLSSGEIVAVYDDITNRKQTEEALRAERDRFTKIADTAPGAICSFRQRPDGSAHFPYASRAIQDVYGLQPEDLAQDASMVRALIHPDDMEHVRETITESARTLSPWRVEYRFRHPKKGEVWIESRFMPEREADGSTIWQGILIDITERKQAEEALRSLSRRLLAVQETERRAIARELHDEIGQMLTGLKLILGMAARLPPEEMGIKLGESQALAGELVGRVRDLSLALRPGMLDDLGLVPALVWHLERVGAQTGVEVILEHTGVEGRRFPAEVETAVYRIVQEALTNVARHAGVKEATVRLWAEDTMLGVQVEDRGAGFDERTALAGPSTGLLGMRERAVLLYGELIIESSPGSRARLTALLPLGVDSEGEQEL